MSLPKPYYSHNGITIYHADCRDVLRFVLNADLVLTDPPYGIGFAAQPTNYQRFAGHKPQDWDNSPFDRIDMILDAAPIVMIWGGNYYKLPISRGWLSWFKPDAPPSMGSFELCWTNRDENPRQISCSIAQTNGERIGHPTQKPLKVIRWCLGFVPDVKTILDPFMGSGTTLRAAKDLGRKAIGIEISEKYCEIAANRMSQEVLGL